MTSPTRSIVALAAAALVGGTGGAMVAAGTVGDRPQTVAAAAASTPAAVDRTVVHPTGALSASAIYAQSRDAVAFITGRSGGGGTATPGRGVPGVDPRSDGGLGRGGAPSAGTATGSGFVVSADGYVVTNAHVIEGADAVEAKIGDGDSLAAKVVGVDRSTDLALLKVSAPGGLEPLRLAASGEVRVGDPTYAIGNPYGLSRTLTTGVVSALHRSIESPNGYAITGVLQTDAAINPGNSGGPLLNGRGEVIGVNSQIATSSSSSGGGGGNVGIGFAVPSDTVTRVVQQLRATGTAKHAYLGVGTAGASGGADDGVGATIASVADGGPAADAGLRAGDVVTRIDDAPVTDTEVMGAAVDAHDPGEKVEVRYTRDGEERTAEVTLGTRPDAAARAGATTTP